MGDWRTLHMLGEEGMDGMDTLYFNKDSQQNMKFMKTEPDSDSEMYLKFSHNADELLDVKEENPIPITFPVIEIKTEKELKDEENIKEEDLMGHEGGGSVTDDKELCISRNDVLYTSSCDICNKGILQSGHVMEHKCKPSTANPLRSQNCGNGSSRRRRNILGYERTCSGKKSHRNEKCKNQIPKNVDEFRHRTNSSEKCFKCGICGKIYSLKSKLVIHQRTHTGERPFRCEMCGKSFIQSKYLIRHRRTHTGEKRLECDACGKKFIDRFSLKRHIRIHTGEKLFVCEICGKGFSDRSNFYVHQRLEDGKQPFCRIVLHNSGTHMRHQRKHDEKRFQCDTCGKCFFEKSDIIRHVKIHTGEKPFICTICGKGFLEQRKLVRHQRRIYLCEKPLKCDICGKEFSSKVRILKHIKSHC